MKRLLLITFALLTTVQLATVHLGRAQSPISLTEANTNLTKGVVVDYFAEQTTIQAPMVGSNQSWDYKLITVASTSNYPYSASTNSMFPAGAVNDSGNYDPLVTGYGILYNQFFTKAGDAITVSGVEFPTQAYSVSPLTGNPADSLWVASQSVVYPQAMTYIPLPLTDKSTWNSSVSRSIAMKLTLTSYGLQKADFVKVSYLSRASSTIGWGNLTLPSATSTSGQTAPSLLVRRTDTRIDSFYLNGSLAPKALLTAFGLTQGMASASYREFFYVQSMMIPIMGIVFTDNTFTTANSAYLQEITPTAGVAVNPVETTTAVVYPNPIVGNEIHIALAEQMHGAVRAELIDLLGNVVATTPLSTGQSVTMQVPANLLRGEYFVRISDDRSKLAQLAKVTIAR
jgi:hypothetical protein